VGDALIRADRRTDMTTVIDAVCDQVKAPKENIGVLTRQMNAETYAVSLAI